jgi:NitT/TauT family transport system ATP-binding protein
MDPEVLLMDEPFAALDSQTRDLLLVELQMIWAKTKKTIIFITHNLLESVVLGNKVIVFTKRPGTVKNEISVNYKRPRLPEDENLHPYFRQVIDSIKNEITDRKSRDEEEEDEVIT